MRHSDRPHPVITLFLLVSSASWLPSQASAQPSRRTPVVEVFESTRDSVVNIASTQVIEVRSPFGGRDLFDDRFDLFFDRPSRRPRTVTRSSVGSGFVLHESGYIVTNAHVVARTAERKAIFADGSEHDAEIIAIDERRDLAILKIDPAGKALRPIPLGKSDDLMIGESVVAIGNPLGYGHTVTAGVVSAVDRSLPLSETESLDGLIQTDASINPGNSGGPLLNILGELIGINTAIRSDAQNIGFAIPVDQLRELLPTMLDLERRRRIRLGLRVDPGVPARVIEVDPQSDAASVVAVDDVVTEVNEQPVRSGIDFYLALVDLEPGELSLAVRRDDAAAARITLPVRELPKPDGARLLLDRLGLEAELIDEQTRNGVRVRGLVITGLQLNGPADAAGLEQGDVLLQIGRRQPTSLDEVGELLEAVRPGDEVDVAILRVQGRTLYRAMTTLQAR